MMCRKKKNRHSVSTPYWVAVPTFFAIDLKVDPIAIPKTGNEAQDQQLEALFATYPYKYKLTEPGLTEKELRKQGFYYVLCSIHARCKIAKRADGLLT